PSVPTKNTPEGTPCVRVDLVDLDDNTGQFVYRNVPLFGGSLVDSTRNHIDAGTVLLVKVRLQPNRGGNREYPVFDKASGDPAAVSRAGQFYAPKGDPFAPQFADPTPPAAPAGSDPWNSAGGAPY